MEKNQTSVAAHLKADNQTLRSLLTKIEQLKQWNTWLTEAIPEEESLLQHCQIVRYENFILYVITDSASWVTRFRYYIPVLLEKLKSYPEFQELKEINCKVRPDTSKKFSSAIRKQREMLSPKNLAILQGILQKIK